MGEWKYSSTFLDFGTRWRLDQLQRLCRVIPGKRAPDTHWIGTWVGPRVSVDAEEKNLELPGIE
jgi:hypothetical protein